MLSQKLGAVLLLAASLLGVIRLDASQIHLKARDLDTSSEPSGFLTATRRANLDRRHILIEFHNPVNQELLSELASRDIVVNNAVGGNALSVSVAENVRLEDLDVAWTGQLQPADKLSAELDRGDTGLHAWIIEFHNDVDARAAANVLTENGLTIVPNEDLLPDEFLVTGERAMLTTVADYDEVAYIFPASPEMLAGKHMNACEGALTQGGAVAQYVTMGSGWASNTTSGLLLNYAFTTLTTKVPASQVESEIQRAMKQWSAITNVQFQQVANSGEPYTVAIEFGTTVNGDPNPFTSLSALAHTYYPSPPNPEPIAGDMHFNPSESWHVGATTDVYTVALHELGHSLGLGHTDNPSDVMYPYYHYGAPLSPNDIAGVQSLYGTLNSPISSGGTHAAPTLAVVVSSPADGSSASNATETFSGSVLNPSGTPSIQWQTSNGQSGHATPLPSGAWTAAVPLASGANMITITATDSSAHSVSRVVRVTKSTTAASGAPGVVSSGGSVPVITVTSPKTGTSTTAASLTISGTASDSNGLQSVTWKTNSQAAGTTTGTTNWSASGIPLCSGKNTVTVQATNINGVARFVTLTITKE